jgi:PPE-repeat protein
MAGGIALPQALQLISGVPLMKVASVFAEKLSITKRLDGGAGLQGLMQKVLQDGNLSSVMQNPMASFTQGIQGQLPGLVSQLQGMAGGGPAGLISALTGSSGLGNAMGALQASGDNLAGLTNGAQGFFAMLGHANTADMAGTGLPASAAMSAVTAPLTQDGFLGGIAQTLPQVVSQVVSGAMAPGDATNYVLGQIAAVGSVTAGSAGALAYGAQMHPLIATVSSVAGALAIPPTFDADGYRQEGVATGFQGVLASIVQPGPSAAIATSLAAQIAHTVHDVVDTAAMTSLGDD